MTRSQLETKYKLGRCKTHRLIKEQLSNGLLESFNGQVFVRGKPTRQVWYRPTVLASIRKPLGDRTQ